MRAEPFELWMSVNSKPSLSSPFTTKILKSSGLQPFHATRGGEKGKTIFSYKLEIENKNEI